MDDVTDTGDLVRRLADGGTVARTALIGRTHHRLQVLARRMLKKYPKVARWEETDDVWNLAWERLDRALRTVPLESDRHYYNLASMQIRRQLIDLNRHYYGPLGLGTHHHSDGNGAVLATRIDPVGGPGSAAEWAEFLRLADDLPGEEREVFNLLWCEGKTQAEAARILDTSVRTVKRRWQSARLSLAGLLGGAGDAG